MVGLRHLSGKEMGKKEITLFMETVRRGGGIGTIRQKDLPGDENIPFFRHRYNGHCPGI